MQAGGWETPTMVARYTENLQARPGAIGPFEADQNGLEADIGFECLQLGDKRS